MKLIGIFTIAFLAIATADNGTGKVEIQPKFTQRFVRIGDKLAVQCIVVAKSDDKTKLVWQAPSLDDVTIAVSQRAELGEKTVTKFSNVTISSMKKEYLGEYKCTYGNSFASFTLLTPEQNVSQVEFTREEGEPSFTLFCHLGGNEVSSKTIEKVEWLKNDTLVSELDESNRFVEIPENRSLVIEKAKRSDADLYVARFTFEGMKQNPYDCHVPFYASPLVLSFEKSKNLIEEDTLELQCQVKGYPHAEVKWSKDGKDLTDKRVQLSTLDGYKNARLVIESVTFDDAGDYTCEAYSEHFNSSAEKTIVVRVKDKLAALWPFLGIVGEVIILCAIIFIYEKRRNKQAESDANNAQDVDGSTTDKKEGLRHRNTQSNNPTA